MNHDCYGDFFTADGKRYYRCFKDGKVVVAFSTGECPNCGRPLRAAQEHGECETARTKYAILKRGIQGKPMLVELPGEIAVSPVKQSELKSSGEDEMYAEWFICSRCGKDNITIRFHFCPDCGVEIIS